MNVLSHWVKIHQCVFLWNAANWYTIHRAQWGKCDHMQAKMTNEGQSLVEQHLESHLIHHLSSSALLNQEKPKFISFLLFLNLYPFEYKCVTGTCSQYVWNVKNLTSCPDLVRTQRHYLFQMFSSLDHHFVLWTTRIWTFECLKNTCCSFKYCIYSELW